MKTNILKAAIYTPRKDGSWGLPLMLWGPPGVAKTAIIRALGQQNNLHVERLSPSERGEGAFGVTPVPITKDGKTVLEYPPPDWVTKFTDDEGILFLDELNTAPPALQPALLGAIQERFVGGASLGPKVRVIGAANPTNQAASGWDLAPPVANRLGHLDWDVPEAEAWVAYMLGDTQGAGAKSKDEEEHVMDAWPEAYAKASGTVTAFIKRRPDLLHKMPGEGDPQQGRAWPSPRTWEYATYALASATVHKLTGEEADEFVAAFIGQGAASELFTYIAEADLPDPVDVLDRGGWEPDTLRLDRTEAVLNSCVALVVPTKAEKRVQRTKALWELLDKVSQTAKDLILPPIQILIEARLHKGPEAVNVMARVNKVAEAGNKGGKR